MPATGLGLRLAEWGARRLVHGGVGELVDRLVGRGLVTWAALVLVELVAFEVVVLGLVELPVVLAAQVVLVKIAEVFLNRLHNGMRLDSDATLYYVLGPNHGGLTSADLQLDTPYNTRKYGGLPPTPINSPGVAAIEAVLHHATGPYLYFVTIDQAGHTAFATTLDRFNQLVAQSRANGVK